ALREKATGLRISAIREGAAARVSVTETPIRASRVIEDRPVADKPARLLTPSAAGVEEKSQKSFAEKDLRDVEDETVLMLTPSNAVPVERSLRQRLVQNAGLLLTVVWFGFALAYVAGSYGISGLAGLRLEELGALLTGVLAPVAFLW